MGYYEWRQDGGQKQPYFIHPSDDGPLVFAGLRDLWRQDGRELLSCAILTRDPTGDLVDLHPRMPVFLNLDQAEAWLKSPHDVVADIANNEPTDIGYYPISTRVNSPRNNDADLILPIRPD